MSSIDQVKKAFAEMKDEALQAKAQVELTLSQGEKFSATYQDRKLKKYSSDETQNAVIRVLSGTGVGIATTENLQPESLRSCFREALQTARDLDEGLDSGKIAEDLIAPGDADPELSLFHSDYQDVPVAERLRWAEILESAALDLDPRVQAVPYSGINLVSGRVWLMNSKGVDKTYQSSAISGMSYALAKEGERSKSGYWGFFRRSPQNLPVAKIAREGGRRALELLPAVQPRTGRWPAILSNEVAATLLATLGSHLSAKMVDEGTSLLKNRLGEKILSDLFHISDDPLCSELPASRPFDAEGTPSRRTPLFEKGVLRNFLTNSFYARKLGLPLTGNAVRTMSAVGVGASNLVVEPGRESFVSLLKKAPEVLVVTEVTGIHSGLKDATGDFSLPAYGVVYRNGEKAEAVEQFVISGNIFEILNQVTAISDRLNEDSSSVRCPDLFIPALSVAGEKKDH